MSSLRLDGASDDGESPPVGGADANAQYWIGNSTFAALPNSKKLGALTTGLVINTGGVPSIADLVGLTLEDGTLTATPGEILTGTANQIVKTGTVLSLATAVTSAITSNSNSIAILTADVGTLFARNLTAGAGMNGGGNLTLDRTFNVGQNADNSIIVNTDDIQLSTSLQTSISNSASAVATLQGRTLSTTAPITGGGTIGTTNLTLALATNGITNALFRQGAARSVVGVAGGSAANVADIVGAGVATFLRDSGAGLAFSGLTAADFPNTTVMPGSYTNADITVNAAGMITAAANGSGGAGGYATIENPNGTPLTARAIMAFSSEFTAADATDTTNIGLATNGVAYGKLAQSAALSVLGVTGNATADLAAMTASTDGHAMRRSGTAVGFGTLAAGAFADGTISGARMSGFTSTRLLVGGASGQIVDGTTWKLNASGFLGGGSVIGLKTNSIGYISVGDADPVSNTGQQFQVLGNSASLNAEVRNTLNTGYSAWQAAGASGARIRIVGEGGSAASTLYGLTRASLSYVDSDDVLLLTTINADALFFGTNSTVRAGIDTSGNFRVGVAMTPPASLAGGTCVANGTGPGATPSGGAVYWVASGVWHFMGTDGIDTIL